MRKVLIAALLAATAPVAVQAHDAPPAATASAAEVQSSLMKPPADARHFTISSTSAKSGDIWTWQTADGKTAYRMSLNLRGWRTETDALYAFGADGSAQRIAVRGFTDVGDATEDYWVDEQGVAHWKTSIDQGSAPIAGKRYSPYGGPWMTPDADIAALVAAGDKGIDLLPGGHGSLSLAGTHQIQGPGGPKTVRLAFFKGFGFAPNPVWLDENNRYFGSAGVISVLPAGFEAAGPKLKEIQDAAAAEMVKGIAQGFLAAANRTPTLVDNVLLFDSVAGKYVPNQAVLIANGKVAQVGPAGSIAAPAGATTIDGRGKTILPGLWDAHRHTGGDDFNLIQNLATGMTNYRSPGSMIDETQSLVRRRAAGDLLAPDGKTSIIIDRKNPLAAQGSLTVSSLEETLAAVHKVKDAGMWGVKFYTSMKPEWIAPAAAEAHKLGLHVHGHIPAGMRPIEAVRAGYDEITHINFIMMQAMPQDVVDKANTAARLEGPAKYGKDVDLDSPEMKAFYAELAKRGTYIDPTLSVWEPMMTSDGSAIPPEYAPFAKVSPPGTVRGWHVSGYKLFDGLTRDDFRKSFRKMVGVVGRLHKAGVPIVAGTDGWGLELVRELELYQEAGMTNAEALQTATIVPARLVGMDKTVGSIAAGKTADIILVDGDVSQDLKALHKVDTVFANGVRLDGDDLRKAAGFTGVPG
ncbi:amidohydrolase family protein [Sphingomonas sabuli]|uniref:Amidohydrolase family protein n=2 Tax=Sphingomonas sabuli TaxID=2764186 RepID=A0A7G9L5Q3_9SPHN|nr:amidohydrolase family protein [Sphingomonas sabuli]